MLKIAEIAAERHPRLARIPFIGKWLFNFLRRVFHEETINEFIRMNRQWRGMEFNNKVLEQFNYSYYVNNNERQNIPETGRVLIVANHPIGTLDGLSLLKLVSEVRPDVKVVVNQFLYDFFEPLHELFIPLDNMSSSANQRAPIRTIIKALNNEEAIIMFPAGEVSRIKPNGIKDGIWKAGFWFFIEKTKCPVLPIHIAGRNSPMFYSLSSIYKTLGTYMLINEMMKQDNKSLRFRIGQIIPYNAFQEHTQLDRVQLSARLRRHLYLLPKKREHTRSLFRTERTISHSTDLGAIISELRSHQLLSKTKEGSEIYLIDYSSNSSIIHEIGRLRELAFRQVGEGSGKDLDLDEYDHYYKHLILWNPQDLVIAGAYRIGDGASIVKKYGMKGLYSASLLDYSDEAMEMIMNGAELGRSFVHPRYWHSRSFGMLWQGLGAYLYHHQNIRYYFGPVSISNSYPEKARSLIVAYYQRYYSSEKNLAVSKNPYVLIPEAQEIINEFDPDPLIAFRMLKSYLRDKLKVNIPTLYKQYTDFTEGGSKFFSFGIDQKFGDCMDGNIVVDLDKTGDRNVQRIITSHGVPDKDGAIHWRGRTYYANDEDYNDLSNDVEKDDD